MVVARRPVLAEVMTGKFWRLLGPVSASPTPSLAVTPSPLKDRLRSMPTPALEKIELMDHLCNRLVISRTFSAKGAGAPTESKDPGLTGRLAPQ